MAEIEKISVDNETYDLVSGTQLTSGHWTKLKSANVDAEYNGQLDDGNNVYDPVAKIGIGKDEWENDYLWTAKIPQPSYLYSLWILDEEGNYVPNFLKVLIDITVPGFRITSGGTSRESYRFTFTPDTFPYGSNTLIDLTEAQSKFVSVVDGVTHPNFKKDFFAVDYCVCVSYGTHKVLKCAAGGNSGELVTISGSAGSVQPFNKVIFKPILTLTEAGNTCYCWASLEDAAGMTGDKSVYTWELTNGDSYIHSTYFKCRRLYTLGTGNNSNEVYTNMNAAIEYAEWVEQYVCNNPQVIFKASRPIRQ